VVVRITGRDLAVWNPAQGQWALEAEEAQLLVGTSSEDIRLTVAIRLKSSMLPWRRMAYDTQPSFVLPNPYARSVLRTYLAKRCAISEDDADRALTHCANSFFGIFTTLERRLRISIAEAEATEVIATINKAMDEAEAAL
jgi:beta-glucosidase